jgi:hypothetical protein
MHPAYPSVYSKVNSPHSISQRGMPGILPVDCGAAFSDMKFILFLKKLKIKTPTRFYPIWIYLNIPSPPLRRV